MKKLHDFVTLCITILSIPLILLTLPFAIYVYYNIPNVPDEKIKDTYEEVCALRKALADLQEIAIERGLQNFQPIDLHTNTPACKGRGRKMRMLLKEKAFLKIQIARLSNKLYQTAIPFRMKTV